MTFRPKSSPPLRPINVGNVVSLGIRLYRSHFKSYLSLALQSILWLFVPIYGWAKIASIQALISRHAFQELINQPESISASRNAVNPQMWSLWLIQILVGGILFGVNIATSIVGFFLTIPLIFLQAGAANNEAIGVLSVVIQFAIALLRMYVYFWFYSRLVISEVPFAVEPNLEFASSISRSWLLTQSSVWRIQFILLLVYLICAPFIFLGLLPLVLIIPTLTTLTTEQAIITVILVFLVSLLLVLALSILFSPLWQAIKAVLYYDLRSRREGFDLAIRSS